ncbi:MFS transporter [Isoptericola croceus]|uniref:MFS transporter n=1 Tax=Isoptericola croceus TaxID=3031406 RepID=UPI0023F9F872|nr:MFS transporter [Isoptericola croceus]
MTAANSSEQDRLWTATSWPFIVSVLALMTSIAFESFAITTVLPVTMADLGGMRWYSFAYSATITAALVGMIVGGRWSDQVGPRRPLLVGGSLFLVGILLCVVAPDARTFVLGRLLQGLGGGVDSVVLYVLIARHIPQGPRPRMFGLLTAAWLVPSMAGPLLAGTLADVTSWRTVFGLVLLGATVSLWCLLRTTRGHPELPARENHRPALGRPALLALLAALCLVVLHLGGQLGAPLSVLVVTGALVALVVTARGVLPAGTLTLRGAPQRLVALRALAGSTVAATDLYLTLYLQAERGFSPTAAGLVIAIGAVGWAVGAWLQGRFASTQAIHHRIVVSAVPLITAGPGCALLYVTGAIPIGVMIGGCIAMGIGMGLAYPRLSSATLALADADQHGAYSSALQAGESMGIGATTALTAVILTSGLATDQSFLVVYALLAGVGCAAVVIAVRAHRSLRPVLVTATSHG